MRKINRLSAQFVRQKFIKPGKYPDGNNLYLVVSSETSRSWVFRYSIEGSERAMGLGSAWDVDLSEARQKAAGYRRLLTDGVDPQVHVHPAKVPTFNDAMREYVKVFSSRWTNLKSPHQWLKTADYIGPLGSMPVDQIKTADVRSALYPIWTKIPEVASRTRGRIEAVLDYSKSLGWRDGDNPARWKGCLEYVLPPQKNEERHHRALPHGEVAKFFSLLGERPAGTALAYRFCILTCTRTVEVIGARWEEIDIERKIWSIPNHRMKARRAFRVPLSSAAFEILQAIGPRPEGLVFEREPGKPLSNNALLALRNRMGLKEHCTTHGFRSSFREWAQHNKIDRIAAEMCLDHRVLGKTESAYMRDDLIEQRREVLEQWAAHVTIATDSAKVVKLEGTKNVAV